MTRTDAPARQPHETGAWPRPAMARRRLAIDTLIAVAVTAAQLGAAFAARSWHPHQAPPGTMTYVLLTVSGLVLMVRRRYPVAVLAIAEAATLAVSAIGPADLAWLALIVAFVTVVLARKRAAAIASLVIGYVASVWPPWLIGQPGDTSVGGALGLAAFLLFLLTAAELVRLRDQVRPPWNGPARPSCAGRPARNACGWPGTCMTWWHTTSRSSTSR